MPLPLILAAVELTTLLEGLGIITVGAAAIALSPDDDDVQKKLESIAIEGGAGTVSGDLDEKNNGRISGALAGSAIGVAAIESTTDCKQCPAIGLVMPHKQSIEGWSTDSIDYQQRICSTTTGHDGIKNYINEYKCQGVAFDGWKETECLFLEAKGKYDNFFKKDGTPWFSGVESVIDQATRQQIVMDLLQKTPYCHWHFLQPVSANYFKMKFSRYTNIKVFHTP
ncbi:Tox-REase-5 domain-containing protein [Proteus mirabilis]|uniref:Tox-REase-5 domain-containing protein n=1 Tax=Proteus mirabilis TaxID=584 RepID=UPI0027839944|nr:restriction endonuclease fold toxin 5 domain-containing protein [Proteus mirabilis]HEJ9411953.1 restriction endonuclease fold toxin 5 domain-containing protein [Proteus mirabilis]HEJ9436502.1 restriction endonuclease fold toxin 5 domain-containing protein [Proteus mirabilis]